MVKGIIAVPKYFRICQEVGMENVALSDFKIQIKSNLSHSQQSLELLRGVQYVVVFVLGSIAAVKWCFRHANVQLATL